jgi:hypothetical protein
MWVVQPFDTVHQRCFATPHSGTSAQKSVSLPRERPRTTSEEARSARCRRRRVLRVGHVVAEDDRQRGVGVVAVPVLPARGRARGVVVVQAGPFVGHLVDLRACLIGSSRTEGAVWMGVVVPDGRDVERLHPREPIRCVRRDIRRAAAGVCETSSRSSDRQWRDTRRHSERRSLRRPCWCGRGDHSTPGPWWTALCRPLLVK